MYNVCVSIVCTYYILLLVILLLMCIDSKFHQETNKFDKSVMLSVDTTNVEFLLCPSGRYVCIKIYIVSLYYSTSIYIIYVSLCT